MHHARDHEPGDYRAIRVAQYGFVIDDLLAGQKHFFRCQRGFAHDAKIAPDMSVALAIGALHVKNGEVGTNGAHGQSIFRR